MELEITIKVPLGAAGVSVEQSTTGAEQVRDEAVDWPPSPADLGLPATPSAAELAPPPLEMLEMIEQLAGRSATTDGPPGLEEVPIDAVMAGAQEGPAEPPDLPNISEMPPDGDEFAPPPVDETQSPPLPAEDMAPTRSRRRKPSQRS
jgi:hypothetical protein